jgi:hypothetical protein
MPPVCFFHRVVPDGGQFQRNGVGVAIPCARHCLRARRELLSSIGPWPLVVVRRGRCLLLRGNQRGKRKEGRLLKKSLSLSHCFPEHWLRPRQMRKRCLSSPSVRSFAYSSNGPGLGGGGGGGGGRPPPPPTHTHTDTQPTQESNVTRAILPWSFSDLMLDRTALFALLDETIDGPSRFTERALHCSLLYGD